VPKVSRKLRALGAVNDDDAPTGAPVKLSDADEDELAASGLLRAHIKALKHFGVLL
jgi:hypothetical protein